VRAEALVARDLRRLQAAPLDAERLERAKSRLLSTIPIAEQSYDGLGRQLVSYISQGLALDEDEVLAKRELTATPEAVRDAMRRWIRPDGFIRVVEGPAPR
jgi:zinc protease